MPDSESSMTRHKYRIYGLIVESELPLSSVEPCTEDLPPEISIVFGAQDYFQQRAGALRQDSDEWIRYTVLDDGSVYIRINQVFEAVVEVDGRRVICARLEDADDRTFEANLSNFALSASLTLKGEECLHATVIEFDGRACGLLGPSGAGKSTLAAFLLGQSAKLVTDDMLRVAFTELEVLAYPGPHRLKLFEETASRFMPGAMSDGSFNRLSRKMMIRPDVVSSLVSAPLPLSTLFWLGDEEPPEGTRDVSTRRLIGVEPVKVLTQSTMATRYLASERLKRQLRFAERLARRIPIYALDYRRDFDLLESVSRQLQRILRT
jgi:hypothetical protein